MSKIFLVVLMASAPGIAMISAAHASKAKNHAASSFAGGTAEHLQGEVVLVRGHRQTKLVGETTIRNGDWVRTGKNGHVRLEFAYFRLDLPPNTTVSVDQILGSGPGKFSLYYGHLRVTLKDHDQLTGNLEVDLPTATMKTALGCEGEFLIHSMRTEAEFRKTLAGEAFAPPLLKELPSLKTSDEFFGQVASIKCPAEVKPERSELVRLRAGDLIHIHARSASFAPVDVGLTELKSVRDTLGLPSD